MVSGRRPFFTVYTTRCSCPSRSVFGGMTTFLFANVIASGVKIIVGERCCCLERRAGGQGGLQGLPLECDITGAPRQLTSRGAGRDDSRCLPREQRERAVTHALFPARAPSQPCTACSSARRRAPVAAQPNHHGLLLCPGHRRDAGPPVVRAARLPNCRVEACGMPGRTAVASGSRGAANPTHCAGNTQDLSHVHSSCWCRLLLAQHPRAVPSTLA